MEKHTSASILKSPEALSDNLLDINLVGLQIFKRTSDILLSIIIFISSLPVCLISALLIKLTDGGRIFFIQKRVGLNGKVFDIYKFRSMIENAENNKAMWASQNDVRITWIGNIIRKTRIDEIPQILNVLKGDMSIIGPRPERPEFTVLLEKEISKYNHRHKIRPGITGFAQVNYRYGASVKDARIKLRYDLYYIKKFSLYLELIIILKTIQIVLFGKGR